MRLTLCQGRLPHTLIWDELMRGPGREAFEAEALEAFRYQYSRGALRGMGWTQRFAYFFGFDMETILRQEWDAEGRERIIDRLWVHLQKGSS